MFDGWCCELFMSIKNSSRDWSVEGIRHFHCRNKNAAHVRGFWPFIIPVKPCHFSSALHDADSFIPGTSTSPASDILELLSTVSVSISFPHLTLVLFGFSYGHISSGFLLLGNEGPHFIH